MKSHVNCARKSSVLFLELLWLMLFEQVGQAVHTINGLVQLLRNPADFFTNKEYVVGDPSFMNSFIMATRYGYSLG
jgi:hypothetical protein